MTDQHEKALAAAKTYFDYWASNDEAGLRGLLSEHATIILRNSGDGSSAPGSVFEGIDNALGYLAFANSTFERMTLVDQEWMVSHDARHVHLHAVGDMTTREGGKEYRNVYVFRIDFEEGEITRVTEYTNPVIWANLGIG
jgi:ketosteroid isomerase-like protein